MSSCRVVSTMVNEKDNQATQEAAYWYRRGDKAAALAARMGDIDAKTTLLNLASIYHATARLAERLESACS